METIVEPREDKFKCTYNQNNSFKNNQTCRAIVSNCEVCIWVVGLREWVTSTEKLGNQDKYLDPK